MAKDSSKKEGSGGIVRREGGDAKKKAHHSSSSSGGKVVKGEGGAMVKVKNEGNGGAPPREKRKPGQKYSTPSPGQADRVFYETLLKQKPESHMAQDWCLAYGVCGAAEAEVLYKTVCKRKGVQPGSSASPHANSPAQKARKSTSGGGSNRPRSSLPKDIEADTGFGTSNAFEGVGTTGF